MHIGSRASPRSWTPRKFRPLAWFRWGIWLSRHNNGGFVATSGFGVYLKYTQCLDRDVRDQICMGLGTIQDHKYIKIQMWLEFLCTTIHTSCWLSLQFLQIFPLEHIIERHWIMDYFIFIILHPNKQRGDLVLCPHIPVLHKTLKTHKHFFLHLLIFHIVHMHSNKIIVKNTSRFSGPVWVWPRLDAHGGRFLQISWWFHGYLMGIYYI